MKKNYLNSNYTKAKYFSIKRSIVTLIAIFVMSFAFAQSTITVQTISSLNPWNITVANPGTLLTWNSTGAVVQVQNGNNVDFDFSGNAANGSITVTTSGTPAEFNGITVLIANDLVETAPGSGVFVGQRIFSIDLSDLNNLQILNLDNNSLISLNLLSNPDLASLSLNNNGSITSLNISANPLLRILEMENTSLTSVEIDNILNTLDGNGQINGTVNFAGISTGNITENGIQAYINLVNKGWSIVPPQGFDRGDAPESYFTSVGNNGPLHFFDILNDRLRIGFHKDNDLNRSFVPGIDADGDDIDDALGLGSDEDGVNVSQFDSYYHTDTNFSLEVQLTNLLGADSYLHAWIDFDRNGTFDTDEYTTLVVPANTPGIQTLTWDVAASGADVNIGQSYVRIRYTSDNDLDATTVGGVANGGEVEDYTFEMLDGTDTDNDGVPDITDVDDDNDGIFDTVEENGDINRDTDGDGVLDRIDLDADGDTCQDVTEAGWVDGDLDGEVGTAPLVVDTDGKVISDLNGPINDPTDAYGPPANNNGSADPDFQVVGAVATITDQPTDQDLIIGTTTFSVVAAADTYQWQEDKQDGNGFVDIVDGGDYSGSITADLVVTNGDISKLLYKYQVVVSNSAFACDPTTTSIDVGYITPIDTDGDLVFDIVDVDDDNDGIFDTVEENGDINRDTDGDGVLDRIDLDADGDTCQDVTEAGWVDGDLDGEVGTAPLVVDTDGKVISDLNGPINDPTDAYGPPANNNGSADPDFQVIGAVATITDQPTDQIYAPGSTAVFSVTINVAAAGSFQWEESTDGGTTWLPLSDGGDYSGTTTADLTVVTPADFSKVFNIYRVIVANVAYSCDPTTESAVAEFVIPGDFDKDLVFDIADDDADNDGILNINEVGHSHPDVNANDDWLNIDSDGDGCPDSLEAGQIDGDGDGLVGTGAVAVDLAGLVISDTNGAITTGGLPDGSGAYTVPFALDANNNSIWDFQEHGDPATITDQPSDQPLVIGVTTFSVVSAADTYQWQEDKQDGNGFLPIVNGGDYAGALTADLQVINSDVTKLNYRYRVMVSNIAYVCDPTTLSSEARYIPPSDFDNDGIFDIVDDDADNDGILNINEVGHSHPDVNANDDWLNIDSDGDGCPDSIEAGQIDGDGDGIVGTGAVAVGLAGLVITDTNGAITTGGLPDGSGAYTVPFALDADNNTIWDFQEHGDPATITDQPTDQNFIPGGNATFTVVATADNYQWEESVDGGTNWNTLTDDATYSGATTTSLTISNLDVTMLNNLYRVLVNNIAYACDPVTPSVPAELVSLPDNDNDGVPDIVDVDDDNDGIFDTDEQDSLGADLDSNGNGTPDRFELDSDSDGCFDVTEAGFTDGDGDGLLGNSPVTVDNVNGQVISGSDGYTTPNDLNVNGVYDFQEVGTDATITSQPIDQDFILNGAVTFSVVATGDTYQWEESTDGVNWTPLVDDATYSGTTTADLTVSNLQIVNYFSDYRVIVTNIAFACDPGITSVIATYNALTDTDGDGVFDIIDVDDDNDGIYDTVEGEFTDSNLDGTPDRISLDADGDTCADVLEAGFTDPDGDGILGTSPVNVDVFGEVTGQGGYTTPNDLNVNGVFDFQEAGSASVIENQPEDIEITLGTDATFEVGGDATFYQWESSLDGGITWFPLTDNDQFDGTNTDRLRIYEAYGLLESSLYRVVLSSPDYACDPNPLLVSVEVMLSFNTELIPSGFSPNGDGANDFFTIPSLDQFPDFRIDIFNRWGSKVYSYSNKGSLNPEWWDGYSENSLQVGDGRVPVGTYFYALYFNDGDESPQSGWVYVNY